MLRSPPLSRSKITAARKTHDSRFGPGFSEQRCALIRFAPLSFILLGMTCSSCILLNVEAPPAARPISPSEVGTLSPRSAMIALRTNHELFFINYDASSGHVPRACRNVSRFEVGPLAGSRSIKTIPSNYFLSINPGTYVVDDQENLDPDHDEPAYLARGRPRLKAFTVTPGSRFFLATYYADGTSSYVMPRYDGTSAVQNFIGVLENNRFQQVPTFEPAQGEALTPPLCASF